MKKPFDPDKIPKWLRRTPEQQQADAALQERLRTAAGPGRRPSPTEARLLRAEASRRSAEAELTQLRIDEHADPFHVQGAEARLAEALAEEGRYAEAAELHPDTDHAERFQQIAAAIDRDDNDPRCDCEVQQVNDPTTGQPITLTSEIVSEMVFSPKHNKMMPLVVCTSCGDMNVKAAPANLEERIRKTNEAHQAEREKRR